MTLHDQIFVKISGIDSFIDRNVVCKFKVISIIETEVMMSIKRILAFLYFVVDAAEEVNAKIFNDDQSFGCCYR